jgi:hypothetical protein
VQALTGRIIRTVALVVTLLVLALQGVAPAAAATKTAGTPASSSAATPTAASATAATPVPAKTWFGPDLDWGSDAPDGYAGRLGATPSMYTVSIDYPIDASVSKQWLRSARAAAAQGAASS